MKPPVFAVTMGDPAGVGPEIIVKACERLRSRLERGEIRLLIVGCRSAWDAAVRLLGSNISAPVVQENEEWPTTGFLPVGRDDVDIVPGQISADAGRYAYLAIECAANLAMGGRVAGLVTAPLNKEALNLAGYKFAGHTDLLAHLTGAKSSVMMLAHGAMRVSHVTTHVALEDVPKKVTPERLKAVIRLTRDGLMNLGIGRPRIAVAALNPHAGEGGLFGRQDRDIVEPVIQQCVATGWDIVGPVPGDTVFVKLRAGQYDGVIAMYHDQGHIPVKLLGFQVDASTGIWQSLSGVNITLGLPIIRTSVDHGTAMDVAGKGIANEQSLVDAIDYAVRLAGAPGLKD